MYAFSRKIDQTISKKQTCRLPPFWQMPLLLLLINQEAITLRGEDDLNAVTAEAIMRTVRDGEREVQGRAEMQAVLDGPRHTLAESTARLQQKHDCPDLSHLTDDALAE